MQVKNPPTDLTIFVLLLVQAMIDKYLGVEVDAGLAVAAVHGGAGVAALVQHLQALVQVVLQ